MEKRKSRFACLIPYVQESVSLQLAINSATTDGWNVMTLHDVRRMGQNKTREALLNRAYSDSEIEFIRYLDDDDLLLPHLNDVAMIFDKRPEIDIVYTNAIMLMPSGISHSLSYSDNPKDNTMQVHPWVWVARKAALKRVKDVYGYVWDYEHPYREGGYLWLKFLQLGMKMHHLPVIAYQYNKSFDPLKISQHPGFADATKELESLLDIRNRQ